MIFSWKIVKNRLSHTKRHIKFLHILIFMNKQLARQILQDIQCVSLQRMQEAAVFLQPFSAAYHPIPFAEENFTTIHPQETDRLLVFVDGGNAELLKTPDVSLHFLRFAAVGFQGTKKVFQKKKEGYVLVTAQKKEEKVFLQTITYGDLPQVPTLSLPFDAPFFSNTNLSQRTKLNTVAELFRALCELAFAKEMLIATEKEAVLVLDRPLLPENSYEECAFAGLHAAAEQKQTIICGLAKTTALLCNNGESVVEQLRRFDKKGVWIYAPVFSSYEQKHNAVVSFVRLHPATKHMFRFEIAAKQKESSLDVAAWLAGISHDAAFLGYPYGLVVADQLARVSNKEKEYCQTLFLSHAGEKEFATTALNAHEILDKINF